MCLALALRARGQPTYGQPEQPGPRLEYESLEEPPDIAVMLRKQQLDATSLGSDAAGLGSIIVDGVSHLSSAISIFAVHASR